MEATVWDAISVSCVSDWLATAHDVISGAPGSIRGRTWHTSLTSLFEGDVQSDPMSWQ